MRKENEHSYSEQRGCQRVPCLKPERVIYLQDQDASEELRSRGIRAKLIENCKNYGKDKGADFIPELAFVLEKDGAIIIPIFIP